MQEIPLSADELSALLLALPKERGLAMLDSCGARHLGSHLLIAGIDPVGTYEISGGDPEKALALISERTSRHGLASVMTLSYDLGARLNGINVADSGEPDLYLAQYDVLFVHDYATGKTYLTGDESRFDGIIQSLPGGFNLNGASCPDITSNFTREEYIAAIETIREYIRAGDTYQANLTRRIEVQGLSASLIYHVFTQLRKHHPAAFTAVIRRSEDSVLSASPERFFKVEKGKISVSPIKGTRRRGKDTDEDRRLREELLSSEKDRAENTMIVDLMRNDIGRICEFGTVEVEKLCDIEEHPSLFHLVSTVSGKLRLGIGLADILRAIFPCGSITGAPKIRTMQIINEIEKVPRGLSMGAIGYVGFDGTMDFSVAIRTMVMRGNEAHFNVGGGIVIDSIPEKEWEETEIKSVALMEAIGVENGEWRES